MLKFSDASKKRFAGMYQMTMIQRRRLLIGGAVAVTHLCLLMWLGCSGEPAAREQPAAQSVSAVVPVVLPPNEARHTTKPSAARHDASHSVDRPFPLAERADYDEPADDGTSLGVPKSPPTVAANLRLPASRGVSLPTASLMPSAAVATDQIGPAKKPLADEKILAVETRVFGVKARGLSFAYVFDRSNSMSSYEGRPLAAAKRELLASLQQLQSTHQFQIIFYNHEPRLMKSFEGEPRMVFGNDEGKQLAESFVASITADGGTDHVKALRMGLQMGPDVLFFLTDADDPGMSPQELAAIRNRNAGTAIHAIEFGYGPPKAGGNFLKQLADENMGQYQYVDVTKLPK